MAKAMKNTKKAGEEKMAETVRLVNAALDLGLASRKEVAQAAGIKLSELGVIFQRNKDVYAKFCVTRKTIVDMAADNLFAIVEDKDHPKNYDASKFVITNYKSDLDASLEAKDGEEVSIELGDGGKKKRPTVIRFGRKKED